MNLEASYELGWWLGMVSGVLIGVFIMWILE